MQLLDRSQTNQVVNQMTEVDEPSHSSQPKLTQVWMEEFQGERKILIAKWILI